MKRLLVVVVFVNIDMGEPALVQTRLLKIIIQSLTGVHSKITRRPTMKHLLNLTELIIIVCLAVLIVAPEIGYSLAIRAWDKVVDMVGELTNG